MLIADDDATPSRSHSRDAPILTRDLGRCSVGQFGWSAATARSCGVQRGQHGKCERARQLETHSQSACARPRCEDPRSSLTSCGPRRIECQTHLTGCSAPLGNRTTPRRAAAQSHGNTTAIIWIG
eukprot:1104263-Rhodomonas_salina.3